LARWPPRTMSRLRSSRCSNCERVEGKCAVEGNWKNLKLRNSDCVAPSNAGLDKLGGHKPIYQRRRGKEERGQWAWSGEHGSAGGERKCCCRTTPRTRVWGLGKERKGGQSRKPESNNGQVLGKSGGRRRVHCSGTLARKIPRSADRVLVWRSAFYCLLLSTQTRMSLRYLG
jgi:hypothetical protein